MIKLIHNDTDFAIYYKPEGYTVHNESPSLKDYFEQQSINYFFVNRLDKETSGLIVVTKSATYVEPLNEALQAGSKKYIAVLRGSVKFKKTDWDWPISDKAEGRKNPQGIKSDQKNALTLVNVIQQNPYLTVIEAEIKTGRQHQIRKHAALAGHPIVGDSRYNDKNYNLKIVDRFKSSRQWLHAYSLTFVYKNKTHQFIADGFNYDHFFK